MSRPPAELPWTRWLPWPTGTALGVVAVALVGAWTLPGSPVTAWRADAAIGQGDVASAVLLYDDVAASGWTWSLRRAALRRSATLLATDLARPDQARVRMARLLPLVPDRAGKARLWAQIGALHLAERNPADAAEAFWTAHQLDPQAPDAAARLVRAARARSEAGETESAERLWERIAEVSEAHRAQAWLAKGRIALARGDAQAALGPFQQAVREARTPDVQAAAQLGVATSLERLGDLDEAIAELDGAPLPGSVRSSRLDGIRARRDDRGR